ncbi:hypothetical protein SGRI78S_00548 [Streptomyces griseus subsp. griseus]
MSPSLSSVLLRRLRTVYVGEAGRRPGDPPPTTGLVALEAELPGPRVRTDSGPAHRPRLAGADRAGGRGKAVGAPHRRGAGRGPHPYAALPQLPGLRAGRHAPAVRGPGVHPAVPVAAPAVRALLHRRQRATGRSVRPPRVPRVLGRSRLLRLPDLPSPHRRRRPLPEALAARAAGGDGGRPRAAAGPGHRRGGRRGPGARPAAGAAHPALPGGPGGRREPARPHSGGARLAARGDSRTGDEGAGPRHAAAGPADPGRGAGGAARAADHRHGRAAAARRLVGRRGGPAGHTSQPFPAARAPARTPRRTRRVVPHLTRRGPAAAPGAVEAGR